MSFLLANSSSDLAGNALFYVFAVVATCSALGVVISRNIVRTAVCLLLSLLGVAGLYMSLHAEFLAAVQLVVYAGGTLVLIIFGIMLTHNPNLKPFPAKPLEVILALGLSLAMASALIMAILRSGMGNRAPGELPPYPIQSLGEALLGDYLVPFEIISVLLLAVMIGAAYLAKARRKQEGRP